MTWMAWMTWMWGRGFEYGMVLGTDVNVPGCEEVLRFVGDRLDDGTEGIQVCQDHGER
jgi:hypothetical protein